MIFLILGDFGGFFGLDLVIGDPGIRPTDWISSDFFFKSTYLRAQKELGDHPQHRSTQDQP